MLTELIPFAPAQTKCLESSVFIPKLSYEGISPIVKMANGMIVSAKGKAEAFPCLAEEVVLKMFNDAGAADPQLFLGSEKNSSSLFCLIYLRVE
ncbi:hypothetical protein EKG40_03670 [Pseudomonas moorei]|nr:hypothetical protein EKG40_03670 [Pseudomonas moorei]